MKDVHSLVLYSDDDQPLFAFYSDMGGVIKYAFAQDKDFKSVVRLAAGYTPEDTPTVSTFNIQPLNK